MRRRVAGRVERMQAAAELAEAVLQQRFVADREQRATERRKHGQLIVRPLDRRQRRAHRLDFLAAVK